MKYDLQKPGMSVAELYEKKKDYLELRLVNGEGGLKNIFQDVVLNRPGLALAGYTGRYSFERIQVLGETEITYLESLSPEQRENSINRIMQFKIPCIVVTKNLKIPKELVEATKKFNVPLFVTSIETSFFIRKLELFLEEQFAPKTRVHGTLVDIYGVGVLYTGKAGIGKSECALDLIERGHRFVGDDLITIFRKEDTLIGAGNDQFGFHMEIRGIGIIDIEALFGVKSVRVQKRVEVEIELQELDKSKECDRTGLNKKFKNYLGVEIPHIVISIVPGKNLPVISEVIAMNFMLQKYGRDPAETFERRLRDMLKEKAKAKGYLEEDYE